MRLRDLFRREKTKVKKFKRKIVKQKKAAKRVKTLMKKTTKKKVKAAKRLIGKKLIAKKRGFKEKPANISRSECPECGSDNVVIGTLTGNIICQDCGAIFAGLMPEVEKKFEEVKQQR